MNWPIEVIIARVMNSLCSCWLHRILYWIDVLLRINTHCIHMCINLLIFALVKIKYRLLHFRMWVRLRLNQKVVSIWWVTSVVLESFYGNNLCGRSLNCFLFISYRWQEIFCRQVLLIGNDSNFTEAFDSWWINRCQFFFHVFKQIKMHAFHFQLHSS